MKMKVQLVTASLDKINHSELLLDDNITMIVLKDVDRKAQDRAFVFSFLATGVLVARGMPNGIVAFVEVMFSYVDKDNLGLN